MDCDRVELDSAIVDRHWIKLPESIDQDLNKKQNVKVKKQN